jgi:ATP-dependent Clp protease protease subunit
MPDLPQPMNRDLFLAKQVTQDSIFSITQAIININNSDLLNERLYWCYGIKYVPQPIRLHIDSYGGELYACFGLVGVMECSHTPVYTYVTGCAISAGFILLSAGKKRFGYSTSTLMLHQLSSGNYGKMADQEIDLEECRRLQKEIESLFLRRTKITEKQLKENYKTKTDWYMSAKEGLKLNVIDEIIQPQ